MLSLRFELDPRRARSWKVLRLQLFHVIINVVQFLMISLSFFSGQEVHPPGPPPQEDPSHPQGFDRSRGRPQDGQGAPPIEGLPPEEVRCQSLKNVASVQSGK